MINIWEEVEHTRRFQDKLLNQVGRIVKGITPDNLKKSQQRIKSLEFAVDANLEHYRYVNLKYLKAFMEQESIKHEYRLNEDGGATFVLTLETGKETLKALQERYKDR